MPIDFPTDPVPGQEFTVGQITWVWNNTTSTWNSKVTESEEDIRDKAQVFLLMGA